MNLNHLTKSICYQKYTTAPARGFSLFSAHNIFFTKTRSRCRTDRALTSRHPIIMWVYKSHCWPWKSASAQNSHLAAVWSSVGQYRRWNYWTEEAGPELAGSSWGFWYLVSSGADSTISFLSHFWFGCFGCLRNFAAVWLWRQSVV